MMILGDSAGFLNSQRLKGIHLAIKEGMLAAETAFEALTKGIWNSVNFSKRSKKSWIKDELGKSATFTGFERGFWMGMLNAGLQQITEDAACATAFDPLPAICP